MASVSSLDKDLRKLRLDKYTPQAANEVRSWIEGTLGERLPSGDLLERLKDGVALCKLVNLATGPPGVRFKQSSMPFVQMENISLFLRACKAPPLNLQEHDVFLTVDLYEAKDPTQVLQCLGAFSRAASTVNPSAFPSPIGPKTGRGSVMSPQSTGGPGSPLRGRGLSNASNASGSTIGAGSRPNLMSTRTGDSGTGRWSPIKSPSKNGSSSPGAVSSWSRREHEGATSPAWNIAQYGYMGGASQGNLGISFGGRRQITSAGPHVQTLAEKQNMRREKEAEEERLRIEREDKERRRVEAEEERARLEEERRWEEETRRVRHEELKKQQEEKRKWEEEERQWKITEEKRRRDEQEAEARVEDERRRARSRSREPKLKGQFLSQYQAEQGESSGGSKYSSRIEELEKELELAREREAEYQTRRQKPRQRSPSKSRARSRSRPPAHVPARMDSWSRDEKEVLRTPRHTSPQDTDYRFPDVREALPPKSPRPLPDPMASTPAPRLEAQRTGGRPLPNPTAASPTKVKTHHTGSRPLPKAPTPQLPPRQNPSPQPPPHQNPSPKPPPRQLSTPQPPPRQEILTPRPQPAPPVNRTSRFVLSNPAPANPSSAPTYGRELGFSADRDAEDRQDGESQAKTKAGGWASKSLLEREMEMERQRQKEWEEAQKETASRPRPADGAVDGIGGGIGGRWDVNQWSGFTGGDSQNRGAQGIGVGRRQIVGGPRPLPGQR
ncbi:putative calponin-like protein [Zalerion maritima]|uniref:Calponin-like protein n=1 Tax=Zalerion maritima TaxID=339359 RepID=A0AAD5WTG5_9PEZI|nr:putative calponin-like protein [Zalerion maritima]